MRQDRMLRGAKAVAGAASPASNKQEMAAQVRVCVCICVFERESMKVSMSHESKRSCLRLHLCHARASHSVHLSVCACVHICMRVCTRLCYATLCFTSVVVLTKNLQADNHFLHLKKLQEADARERDVVAKRLKEREELARLRDHRRRWACVCVPACSCVYWRDKEMTMQDVEHASAHTCIHGCKGRASG